MKQKTLWLVETAAMLALLVTLQALTKPLGQIVTGICVNAVLAIATLLCGIGSGSIVALLSPIAAFLLGIAPQILTVPAIMAGNLVFVLIIGWRNKLPGILRLIIAAAAKFATLYLLVVQVICNLAAAPLQQSGLLKPAMLSVLPATFTWPQLITALLGGAFALFLAPLLRKALRK